VHFYRPGEQIRARRIQRLPDVCNGRQAAWALVVPPYAVSKLIASGRLPAEKVFDDGDRFHFEIFWEDVKAVTEELP